MDELQRATILHREELSKVKELHQARVNRAVEFIEQELQEIELYIDPQRSNPNLPAARRRVEDIRQALIRLQAE